MILMLYKTPPLFHTKMRRTFKKNLIQWKEHPLRIPLIVRGARQVGKTFVIQAFGKEEFENLVMINFEVSPEYQSCFDDMEPDP